MRRAYASGSLTWLVEPAPARMFQEASLPRRENLPDKARRPGEPALTTSLLQRGKSCSSRQDPVLTKVGIMRHYLTVLVYAICHLRL